MRHSGYVPELERQYCDRVIRDGKTCKQIAPALKHKERAEHDKVISTFDRVKRKLYMRVERNYNLSGERAKKDMTYEEEVRLDRSSPTSVDTGEFTSQPSRRIFA